MPGWNQVHHSISNIIEVFQNILCDDRSILCGNCRSAFHIFHAFCGVIMACLVATRPNYADYYNITREGRGGGLPNLLQYYNRGGGVYRDPKFVLRNKWTAPKGPANISRSMSTSRPDKLPCRTCKLKSLLLEAWQALSHPLERSWLSAARLDSTYSCRVELLTRSTLALICFNYIDFSSTFIFVNSPEIN